MKKSLLLAVLLLAACSPAATPGTVPAPPSGEKRSENQVLQIGQGGLPATMSPESSGSNIPIYWAMFDSLAAFDDKLNVIPWVAESWTQQNPTAWRMVIRKDLKFSNGDALTAADVAFTGNLAVETRTPAFGLMPNLTRMTKVDDYTVDIVTSIADASILAGLPYLWVMPQKYYTEVGKGGFAAKPIGSGPYDLTEFRTADIARFTKRAQPHAFRKPLPEQLVFRALPELASMRAGFQTGDLDVVTGTLSPDLVAELEKSGGVIETRKSAYVYAVMGQPEMAARNTPLKEKKVREAINYAINKDVIAQQIFRGKADPVGQLANPENPAWNPDLKPYPYDPAKARQLLAEAGYPDGFKLPVGIAFTPSVANPLMMQAIQADLKAVGIESPLTSVELGVFVDMGRGVNGQAKGDLHFLTTSETTGFGTSVASAFACNKPPNAIFWCDPEFDKLMQSALLEPDREKRGVLLRRGQSILRDNAAVLYVVLAPQFVVKQPAIKGFNWTSLVFYNFDGAYRIA